MIYYLVINLKILWTKWMKPLSSLAFDNHPAIHAADSIFAHAETVQWTNLCGDVRKRLQAPRSRKCRSAPEAINWCTLLAHLPINQGSPWIYATNSEGFAGGAAATKELGSPRTMSQVTEISTWATQWHIIHGISPCHCQTWAINR